MSALPSSSSLFPIERAPRISLLSEVGVVELLTLREREVERLFDLSEGGIGVLSQDPIPAGSLALAGAACTVNFPGQSLTGTCVAGPNGEALACLPPRPN